jgi:hypothetical protein
VHFYIEFIYEVIGNKCPIKIINMHVCYSVSEALHMWLSSQGFVFTCLVYGDAICLSHLLGNPPIALFKFLNETFTPRIAKTLLKEVSQELIWTPATFNDEIYQGFWTCYNPKRSSVWWHSPLPHKRTSHSDSLCPPLSIDNIHSWLNEEGHLVNCSCGKGCVRPYSC